MRVGIEDIGLFWDLDYIILCLLLWIYLNIDCCYFVYGYVILYCEKWLIEKEGFVLFFYLKILCLWYVY